jgi:uncharacterized protein
VIEELERRGIGVEVLQTADAVRRYGELDGSAPDVLTRY